MGFFGFLKKKKIDSGSAPSNSIIHRWFAKPGKLDLLMEIDNDLKEDLQAFKTMVLNYKKKLDLIHSFVENGSAEQLDELRKEMELVKMMVEIDDNAERVEEKYTIRALKTIQRIIEAEELYSQKNLEEEVRMNLNLLRLDIEKLKPLLIQQLEFFYQTNAEIQKEKEKIGILLRAVKDEAILLGIENSEIKTLQEDIEKLKKQISDEVVQELNTTFQEE